MSKHYSYVPSDYSPFLLINFDENVLAFENVDNIPVTLNLKLPENSQAIKNVWALVSREVRENKIPITIKLDQKKYTFSYNSGYQLQKHSDNSTLVVGGRCVTLHHLKYCAENWVRYSTAVQNIVISEGEFKRWNLAKREHFTQLKTIKELVQ